MAWDSNLTLLATRVDGVDANAAADINQIDSNVDQVQDNVEAAVGNGTSAPTRTIEEMNTLFSVAATSLTVSDDPYVVTDLTTQEATFFVNPSAGDVAITLPTLADNTNKKIKIICTDLGGKVTIDGEGAETIGGYSDLSLQSKNDSLWIIGEAGEWQIEKYRARYDTGWQNRSDWTNVHLGSSAFDFDNRSAGFTTGELITEATSGNTGIIQSMTDAVSGTIIVKNVTGTGIWTNDREVTGSSSGSTCDVDEVASNKNQDTNVSHDFNVGFFDLIARLYVSTDNTDANAFMIGTFSSTVSSGNYTLYPVDADNILLQVSINGLIYAIAAGNTTVIDDEDWYYKIVVEAII